ncbi:T9SS type A sorting domain-containing protein [Dokdonia sinensis]|nr:T9SS type A sorting domain-containing protein [Dokdonia sinensis]
MKKFYFIVVFLFSAYLTAQNPAENLIPTSAVTHTATADGDWSDPAIWSPSSVPGEGAIVHIPQGTSVAYTSETSPHIFGIRVDGNFTVSQTDAAKITRLEFDTFYGSPSSVVQFLASGSTDGSIEITINPFDILNHESTVTTGDNAWSPSARGHYNDGLDVNQIDREVVLPRRFNTFDDAVAAYAGQSPFSETSTTYNDGIGVTGRYEWDPMQMSIGMIIRGEFEVIGQEKTTYVQLAQDALRRQNRVVLAEAPMGWNVGDEILITKSGKLDATQNGTETFILDSYDTPTTLVATDDLDRNHEGTPDADFTLHCYVGNLSRNIVFQSGSTLNIHHRGHLMIMQADENVQIKNARFKDMGRTDKSRWLDDSIFNEWVETDILKSKYSPLGQSIANSYRPNPEDITNPRGRYSIHLHKNGSTPDDNLIQVTGNVVWGNPGWGITHHDAYANVSDNVVYDVTGAGIVSETGSETGFWDNNLVVDIKRRPGSGPATDPYIGSLFFNDYLFSGAGLAMKGRAVICNDNVIADVVRGISIMNMNPNVGSIDRVDPIQLATVRPNFLIDQFPLSQNGYSKEGDGVMPVEVALVMNRTTVISSTLGFRSIEREMGLNHESRSVFDGLILWGTKQGITNTYQADYTFHDVFISGDKSNSGSPTEGLYMWKHSHNHVYDNIKFRDLDNAMVPSKLVLSGNGEYKTRNNGFTPWIFIDLKVQNVAKFYEIVDEDNNVNALYPEHADNPIFFTSQDVMMDRETTFTLLDEASTGLPYYEIPGDLQFPFAAIDYTEADPEIAFGFAVDGVITDKLGTYKFGTEQAAAQGSLRNGYPERLYQFASEAKFIEYVTENGVYENPNDGSLYFIINEIVPDRLTSVYKSFPIRIKIMNAPSSGVFANPQTEAGFGCEAEDQLISRKAVATQSSTQSGVVVSFNGEDLPVDPNPFKAIDGNNNARDNAQFLQRFSETGVPVGTYSLTESENQPWYDLDFGEEAEITYIDIWNTVTLNGQDIAPTNNDLTDFHILLDDESFAGKDLTQALADANWSYHQTTPVGRKLSLDTEVAGTKARYMRIQKVGVNTQLKLAEVEVLGRMITDTTAPMVVTQNIIVQLDENGVASIVPDDVDNGSQDACGIDEKSLDITSFDCSNVGNNTVTLTVTDVNSNESTATAIVTVEDNIIPTVTTQNITVSLDASGTATITADQIDNGSTDNCDMDSLSLDITTFDCDSIGDNTVTLTVTDVNNNESTATAIVTVEDNIIPTVTTQNITVSLDASGAATITADQIDNGSTDNCDIDSLSLDITTFDCNSIGDNTVTLTVTDVNSNESTATAIVTVEDNIIPTVTTQNITVSLDASGTATITADQIDNGSTDNCDIDSLSLDITTFDCDSIGDNTVTLTVTDVNSNESTATAIVTVEDTIAPEIDCLDDQSIVIDEAAYELPDYWTSGQVTAIDNCTTPVVITSQSPAPGTALNQGIYTITLTAEDDAGLISSCAFELEVASTLSIETSENLDNNILLTPNPSNRLVRIEYKGSSNLDQISMYDIAGRLIRNISLKENSKVAEIDVSNLSNAVYLVIIKTVDGGMAVKRLIKN